MRPGATECDWLVGRESWPCASHRAGDQGFFGGHCPLKTRLYGLILGFPGFSQLNQQLRVEAGSFLAQAKPLRQRIAIHNSLIHAKPRFGIHNSPSNPMSKNNRPGLNRPDPGTWMPDSTRHSHTDFTPVTFLRNDFGRLSFLRNAKCKWEGLQCFEI